MLNKEEFCDMQGQKFKTIISSNISDIFTRLQVLSRIKRSGRTDILTEASNQIDELYKRG